MPQGVLVILIPKELLGRLLFASGCIIWKLYGQLLDTFVRSVSILATFPDL